jgi:branched-chain amino acid transport system ATP-binding protein
MLEIKNMSCGYGPFQAVGDLSLALQPGTITGLVGANGAGKSSTLMCIAGHVGLHGGQIWFEGADISSLPAHQRVRQGIAISPEGRRLFKDLSVEDNLRVGGLIQPASHFGQDRDYVLALFPRLAERLDSLAGNLSGGEQQMLAIARILRTGASLLLLDEPTEGLAPVIVQQIGRLLLELKERGMTILLVEQNFHFASKAADRHYIVEHGRVVDTVDKAALTANKDMLHKYLGV